MSAKKRSQGSDLAPSFDDIPMSDLDRRRVQRIALLAESFAALFVAAACAYDSLRYALARMLDRQPAMRGREN